MILLSLYNFLFEFELIFTTWDFKFDIQFINMFHFLLLIFDLIIWFDYFNISS